MPLALPRRRTSFLPALALAAAACGDEAPRPAAGEPPPEAGPFLALYADGSGEARPGGPDAGGVERPGKSFYLAVRKDALDERWFLSAYLKQLHPGGVFGGAAASLNTRVVSFRVQNEKLFVFDADDRKKQSDVFDPEVVVEAYPLVDPKKLGHFPGRDKYVVFDPAAGLNRISVLNDAAFTPGTPSYPSPLEVDLAYSQNVRVVADGVTFEQVFSGHFREPDQLFDPGEVEPNPHRASGTLALALRRYAEGEGFTPKPAPEREFYFLSAPRLVPNAGFAEQSAVRWNLRPGAAPVRWLIAPEALAYQQEFFPEYDLVGAFRRGVESWNAAFGFEALRADLAPPGQSFADDDVNYFLFDPDPTAGGAFADWRTNPNTGEVRGASVYFTAGFVLGADFLFSDDPAAPPALFAAARPPAHRVAWGPLEHSPLCVLSAHDAFERHGAARAGAPGLTKKEKVERFLQHVAAHEIGHALGLRHNFKGSLVPPSSSLMEYVIDEDAVLVPEPAAYDVDAVRYLYDLSPEPPAQPFCTDGDVALDPDCNRFDRGVDPLADDFAPAYREALDATLGGDLGLSALVRILAGEIFDYVRAAPTSERRLAAWNAIFEPLRSPPGPGADPAAADAVTSLVLSRLFPSDPSDVRAFSGDIREVVSPDPLLTPQLAADLRAVLVNGQSVWGFPTRQRAVGALRQMQTVEALAALAEAREVLAASLPGLEGDARLLTKDLIAHIDRATAPYFE